MFVSGRNKQKDKENQSTDYLKSEDAPNVLMNLCKWYKMYTCMAL